MLSMAVVASPDYLARRGVPDSPEDLVQHNCIGYRHTSSGALFDWEFTSPEVEGHDLAIEPKGNFVSNDDEATIQAALQDIGLAQHMDFSVRKYLDSGSLIRAARQVQAISGVLSLRPQPRADAIQGARADGLSYR